MLRSLVVALGAVPLLVASGCRGGSPTAPGGESSSRPTPVVDAPAPSAPPTPAAAPSPAPPNAAEAAGVSFAAQWQGRIQLPLLEQGNLRPAPQPPKVIRDQAAYEQFVAMIPKQRIQMKLPAPPSSDPLLAMPPIDFAKHLLLVAVRTDSMYVHPKLDNARLAGGKLVVDVVYPPLGPSALASARADIGTYHAVLVPRVAEEVEVRDARQRASSGVGAR